MAAMKLMHKKNKYYTIDRAFNRVRERIERLVFCLRIEFQLKD